MFLSKLKKNAYYRKNTEHMAQNHHKSYFYQYLIGFNVETSYSITEICQNVNMITSEFFENF